MKVQRELQETAEGRVLLARESEVRYWCALFGCSEVQLHRAIKAVGRSPERIREYLGKG